MHRVRHWDVLVYVRIRNPGVRMLGILPPLYLLFDELPWYMEQVQCSRQSPTSPFIPLTARNTTTMFLSCALFSGLCFNIVTVFNFADNEGMPDEFYVTNKDGFGRYEWWGRNVFSPALGLFVVMTELNVCLMWIDMSTQVKNFQKSALQNLGKSRKIIIYTQIAMVVVMALGLIGFTLTGIPLIGFLSAPFPAISAGFYIHGARQMTALFRTPTSHGENVTQQEISLNHFFATLKKVTRRVVFLNIFFATALVGYALTQGDEIIRELSPAEHWFTVEKLTHHSNVFALCFLTFVLWEYLRSTSKSTVARKNTIETASLFHTNNLLVEEKRLPKSFGGRSNDSASVASSFRGRVNDVTSVADIDI